MKDVVCYNVSSVGVMSSGLWVIDCKVTIAISGTIVYPCSNNLSGKW